MVKSVMNKISKYFDYTTKNIKGIICWSSPLTFVYPFCVCCYYYFLFLATSHVGSVSRPGMETIKAPAVEWRVLTIEMREVPVFVNQKELGAPSFKLSWCFTHACNFALITPNLTMSVCVCLFIYLCTNLRLEYHGFCSHVSFKSCL